METQAVTSAPKVEAPPSADVAGTPEKTEAPKRSVDPSGPSGSRTLSVSAVAVDAVRRQLAKRGTPDAAIRVGVRGGGCSGFSYVIEYDDKPARTGDIVMEFAEEGKATVRVFCDKKSILYLQGSVLDWEKTLMYTGFKFKNPQEASRCGCGHSFTVA